MSSLRCELSPCGVRGGMEGKVSGEGGRGGGGGKRKGEKGGREELERTEVKGSREIEEKGKHK